VLRSARCTADYTDDTPGKLFISATSSDVSNFQLGKKTTLSSKES
jgi:hypothetical protein